MEVLNSTKENYETQVHIVLSCTLQILNKTNFFWTKIILPPQLSCQDRIWISWKSSWINSDQTIAYQNENNYEGWQKSWLGEELVGW